jgi:hypothetical protein
MKLPEWFLRAIKNDDDRKRGELGLIKSTDRIDVICENCGITLNNLVKSRLVRRNLENPNYRILCKQCSLRTTNVEVGTKFGDLTVIKEVEQRTNRNNRRKVLCKCICGREVTPFLENLLSGATVSCRKHNVNAIKASIERGEKTDPQKGDVFGKLTILERIDEKDRKGNTRIKFKCKCECGRTKLIYKRSLLSGATTSCGCCLKSFPEWFINLLANKKDKERAIKGDILSTEMLEFVCEECGEVFTRMVGKVIHVISGEQALSCRCEKCRTKETEGELEIKSFLRELGVKDEDVIRNSRDILNNGQEVDFYIKSKKLGIEYNGDFWHSEEKRGAYYHRDKFIAAEKANIHLIQIFESDWNNQKDKIKCVLKDMIISPNKIYARKCKIVVVDNNDAKLFYDKYHLQGYTKSCQINYGLVYQRKLIAVMGFGSSNYHSMNKEGSSERSDNSRFELHRYAVTFGYSVVGGASKLLKAFERDYKPTYILSYSCNDWFRGEMYEQLGFRFTGMTTPRYYWIKRDEILNREECQLKHLSIKYPELYEKAFEKNASNKENYIMTSLGYVKISRAGTKRWEKFYNKEYDEI